MEIRGKTAVVTGGTKGIGRAIAESLVRAGVDVCISARHPEELEETVAYLNGLGGGRAVSAVCDVRSFEEVEALFDHASGEFGGVDILINNAGIGSFKTVEGTSPDEFRAVLETNLSGVYYCCHLAIPKMRERGGGYIINISSLAGVNAHPKMATYNASKFGLNGFSEAMMQEVRQDNIRVSYIMPGSVNTYFGDDTPSESQSWQLQPEDIADVVLNLLTSNDRSLQSRIEIRPSKPPVK